MKKYIAIILVALSTFGCDDYLDVIPDNVATLDHAFKDKTTTLRYLATCYSYLPLFNSIKENPAHIGSDEFYIDPNSFYGSEYSYRGISMRKGLQSADNPYFDMWGFYKAIRVCNTFLERVPAVTADLEEQEKLQWLAEVKVLKALYHFRLMRLYGAVPVIKENLQVDVDIEETRIDRTPFDEGVSYLVSLLDEAIPDLPAEIINISADAGHITKVVAATLKADILVTAASPLFNGNADLSVISNNDGTKLYNPEYDVNKWIIAAEASKQALDFALAAGHTFFELKEYPNISDETRLVLNRKQCYMERWNSEIIFSSLESSSFSVQSLTPYFSQEQHKWAPYNTHISPTFATTEFFYSNNGVPIDEDINYPYADRLKVVNVPESEKYYALPNYEAMQIHLMREPRYYSNLGFDGCRWFGNGRFKDIDSGAKEDEISYVFRMKEGEEQGKNGSLRFSPTGIYCRKWVHINSVYKSKESSVTEAGTYAVYRLAELYLLYAEALNESLDAPTQEVYDAIDAVRQAAGLKGVVESWETYSKFPDKVTSKDGMRDIIRHERTAELAFEGKRYNDLRRWKTASEPMNQPIKGLNIGESDTQSFNQVITLGEQLFYGRDYFLPISTYNLRVNKNLVQNPLW
ncbi:RagB/SusD family nutrient uptake outer membrane protein [Prolixibacteraceae bacterium JC049]|nr:RagB/SusD family nutrient uptake outer membrane protein [Prolixibacteraceae bacterium JC049]